MDFGNKLFILSTILVLVLLVSLNYSAIVDFYTYSVPLNDFRVSHNDYGMDAFDTIKNKAGSTCFTTIHHNQFCYTKPRMFENGGVAYIDSPDEIQGELHFTTVGSEAFIFTIKNMTSINDNEAIITFADKNYRIGNSTTTTYEITDKFEFSRTIKKFDTFISNCANHDGTYVNVVQYLGITTINGTDYFTMWHVLASSEHGIKCDYPQIIEHSFGHNFRDL